MGNYNATPSMGFGEAISTCFKKYFDISGRARRSEYWFWCLFTFLVGLVTGWIPFVGIIITLALLIPNITVTVRRLHDVGLSGWFYFAPLGLTIAVVLLGFLLGLITKSVIWGVVIYTLGCIGVFVWWLFFVLIKDSTPGANKWGDSPKYPTNNI